MANSHGEKNAGIVCPDVGGACVCVNSNIELRVERDSRHKLSCCSLQHKAPSSYHPKQQQQHHHHHQHQHAYKHTATSTQHSTLPHILLHSRTHLASSHFVPLLFFFSFILFSFDTLILVPFCLLSLFPQSLKWEI